MSDKWTPAPWTAMVMLKSRLNKVMKHGRVIATVPASLDARIKGVPCEEAAATAHLIAAAPDMAKALDALLRVIDVTDIDEAQRAIALGRAALAKARGRA